MADVTAIAPYVCTLAACPTALRFDSFMESISALLFSRNQSLVIQKHSPHTAGPSLDASDQSLLGLAWQSQGPNSDTRPATHAKQQLLEPIPPLSSVSLLFTPQHNY